ncbi:MAG TPA: cation:proton antiporter [Oleiagrimonas sp.]|nr:cation:proton antiporter [Oleiagrimonas sp.]
MHHASEILLALFIVFVAAQVGAEVAQRLKLPGVVGEIIAGCVIGPSVLGWIQPAQIAAGMPLDVLAEMGVVFLMFSVGLETRLDDLKKVGRSAMMVGVLGVMFPFVAGALWAHGGGYAWTESMFVAAAMVATSAGITARVLQQMGVLKRIESQVIMGAAVIDDILAMLLLGVVSSLHEGAALDWQRLILTLVGAIGFVLVVGWGGARMMRRDSRWLDAPLNPHSPLAIVLAMCLGLAFAATRFGLAAIIGAFLAGMIASESRHHKSLEKQFQPLLTLVTPFFFVVIGARIELAQLADSHALWMLLVITVIAIITKLAGGFLGALSMGKRGATIVGFGMVPRGEVGVVVASLGLAVGAFGQQLYAIIVAMSLLTAMITPPVLALLMRKHPEPEDDT